MHIQEIDKKNIKTKELKIASSAFKDGKVVVYPTDTIYGIGCRANCKKAIRKIYKIKERQEGKPLLVLISSFKMLVEYAKVNSQQLKIIKRFWPGPVTFILESTGKLPREIAGGLNTLAIRFPKDDFLRRLIGRVGMPIVSTSVNVSGQKPMLKAVEIVDFFSHSKLKPDLVLTTSSRTSKPSKIIDLTEADGEKAKIKYLRK